METVMIPVFAMPGLHLFPLLRRQRTVLQNGSLITSYVLIVFPPSGAVGNANRIYKYFQALLLLYFLKQIPTIVQIIIQHNILVISLQFFVQSIHISDLLAGRTVVFVRRIFLSDIFLQNRGHDHHFIHTIIAHFHAEIAEGIMNILLLQ